jgi:hypothetical protein
MLQKINQFLIFIIKLLSSIFNLFIMSFEDSSQNNDWTSFVDNDMKILFEQSKSSFNVSKFFFNAWNNLMTNSFKFTTKSFSNNFILFENRQFVIWTMNIENDFENWWTIDISWRIDTTFRKREHRKFVWDNRNWKKIVWTN